MRRLSRRQTFWLLMAAAGVTMWLPVRLTAPLRNVFDPVLAPLSSWLYRGGQDARGALSRWTGRASDGRSAAELEQMLEAARRELLTLHRAHDELTEQLSEATRVPAALLGPRGRMVPARVLARDAVAWREAVLIDAGRNARIEPKLWAAGAVRAFIDRGADSELTPEQWAVLPLTHPIARQIVSQCALIGRVEAVGQVTARIKLLTDPDSHVPARLYDPDRDRAGAECVVDGVGPGRLRIERVAPPQAAPGTHDTDEPPAKVGDLVLTAPGTPNLPLQLLIGQVVAVERRQDNPVEYRLAVAPAVDYATLARLFVLDAAGAAGAAGGAGEGGR